MLKINIPIKFEGKKLFSVDVNFKIPTGIHIKTYYLIAKNKDMIEEFIKQEYPDCIKYNIMLEENKIKEVVNV